VLTAAHCVNGANKVEIAMGGIRRKADGLFPPVKVMVVSKAQHIIKHKNFNPSTLNNDIALIKLPENAPLDHIFVGSVSLPMGIEASKNFVGVTGTVSGYGRTSDGGSLSNFLKYIRLPIMSNAECAAVFGTERITASSICLRSLDGKSACSG
jgi:secreted trypsin-like serine protease